MIQIFKAGAIYFAVVFGVGFLLGMIRVPFLVPHLGQRVAELIELPFMLIAIVLAARWIVDRYSLGRQFAKALAIGVVAAILLLSVEFSVVLWIRGLTISQVLADRDPVAGTVYYIAVTIFAMMPAAISFRSSKND